METFRDVAVIILAAGKGTRMKSDLAKVLHCVAGKSMIIHVIEAAQSVVPEHIHVVIGHQAEKVRQMVSGCFDVNYSYQQQLLGTGDAVKSTLPDIDTDIKDILVLCGDVPLIQPQTLKKLIEGHRLNRSKVTVLATEIDNPTGYGRIVLDGQGNLAGIVEQSDATPAQQAINTINTGIYCFDKTVLSAAIDLLKPDNNQAEYYLTDVVRIAKEKHHKVSVVTLNDPRQVIGVNTLEELDRADRLIQEFGR